MKQEKNDSYRLIIVFILSIIFSFFIIIFTIPKANALVVNDSQYTKIINNVTYYGFDIPTRVTGVESQSYVNIGTIENLTTNNQYSLNRNIKEYFYSANNFHYSELDNYISSNNIDLSNINFNMTTPIEIGPSDVSNIMGLNFSFHPGVSSDSSDMLSNGYNFNYDNYYSFDFDIAIWNKYQAFGYKTICNSSQTNGSLIVSQICSNFSGFLSGSNLDSVTLGTCTSNSSSANCSSANNGYSYNVTIKYKDSHLQVLHFSILFNQFMKFKFSDNFDFIDSSSNTGNSYFLTSENTNFFSNVNNRIPSSYYLSSPLSDFSSTKLFISQPYNIVAWNTYDKFFCQGSSCWSQEDSNNSNDSKDNLEKYTQESFFTDMISGIQGLIGRDYGFSGIVNKTFDFIISVLSSVKNSQQCYSVDIEILGKHILMPCAVSFWGRQDVSAFVVIYNTVFVGALSYLLAWKIYKDLLNTFSPSSKIVNGNEVDSL